MDIKEIIKEKVTLVREWQPGIYVVQTEKAYNDLKEKVATGEINNGFNAFVPDYIKEINSLSHEEILKRVWGDDWKNHEWGK